MATNFGLTTSTPPVNVIQSINYLLSSVNTINSSGNVNLGNVLQVGSNNAIYSNVGIIGYINAYMDVKYSNSATGSSGFTSNSAMANYYGVYNSATNAESANPVDYQWTQVAGGFGTTRGLYYTTGGGGTISFFVGNAAPNQYYQPVPDDVPIVLASVSSNLVQTRSIEKQAVTQTISIANNAGYQTINWVNGANTNPSSPDFLWPSFTRGFAIGGGATIVPSTTGAVNGSTITVNYNALINSATNPQYNLVELWKSGSSAFYKDTFTISRSAVEGSGASEVENFFIPGNNGSAFAGNLGNIVSVITGTTNNLYDGICYNSSATANVGNGLDAFVFGQSGTISAIQNGSPNFVSDMGTRFGAYPLFNMYGSSILSTWNGSGPTYNPTVIVGSSGYIAYLNGEELYYQPPNIFNFESSGTFADLFDVAADLPFYNAPGTLPNPVNYVAVGSGGTLLYNTRSYSSVGNVTGTTGWNQAVTNTTNVLNAVASNAVFPTTRATAWVAVGTSGTILTSTSNSGPWTSANVIPTTQNLNAVAYSNGYWVAVGDAGTVITSTDGSNWTGPYANPASGIYTNVGTRNLYGVAGGQLTPTFVVSGQEIIMSSSSADVSTASWSNVYIGGASYISTLTRLQYQGSWANVANVSLPPASQQITNGQVVSGTYIDTNYTAGNPITYYLVVGNMAGNVNVTTNGPNMTVTELKR